MSKKEEKKLTESVLGCPITISNLTKKLIKHKGLHGYIGFQVFIPESKMEEFAHILEFDNNCYITLCDFMRFKVKNKNIYKNKQVIDITLEESE